MTTRHITTTLARAGLAFLPLAASTQMNKASVEAVKSYFYFIDADGGSLMAEQTPAEDDKRLFVLDVRDAGQFGKDHIPRAANIAAAVAG